jgi:hypothetical protein
MRSKYNMNPKEKLDHRLEDGGWMPEVFVKAGIEVLIIKLNLLLFCRRASLFKILNE